MNLEEKERNVFDFKVLWFQLCLYERMYGSIIPCLVATSRNQLCRGSCSSGIDIGDT